MSRRDYLKHLGFTQTPFTMSHIRCNCKTPNYNPIGRCLSCGGFHEGDPPMTNNTNPELPAEVENALYTEAEEIYNKLNELAQEQDPYDFGLPMCNKVKAPIEAALTAYATKLHQAEQENTELRRWKIEAAELLTKIHSYAHKHLEIKLGESIVDFVIARAKERDEFKSENDKLKQQATGWRPLLEKVLVMNEMWGDLPGEFINEVKSFLYGE